MRLHLNERWVKHLCNLPEDGMGYQIVDIVLRSGEQIRGAFVFNAEEVEWPAGQVWGKLEDIVEIRPSGRTPHDRHLHSQ